MKSTKVMKNLKAKTGGITLIALVITIIVLLILAGISIMMLTGENSILNRAGEAKEGTVVGQEREAITIAYNGVLASYIGEDVAAGRLQTELQNNGNNATAEASGQNIKVTFTDTKHVYIIGQNGEVTEFTPVDRTGIEVGDYIDYEPTEGTYPASKLTEAYTGNTSSSYNQNDLTTKVTTNGKKTNTVANWRILRIYDDGSMDIIGDPTSYIVQFCKARGYNNGPKVMHDICAALYSNSAHGITARSVQLEDFEVEGRGSWSSAKSSYISNEISNLKTQYDNNYNNMQTYVQMVNTSKNTVTWQTVSSYYPNIYASEKGAGINTITVNATENKETLKNYLDTSNTTQRLQASTSGLTTEYTYYYININNTNYGDASVALYYNNDVYWLASRCVKCTARIAEFNLRIVSSVIMGDVLHYSTGNDINNYRHKIRPVVTLGDDVQVTPCTGTNSESNTHTINW